MTPARAASTGCARFAPSPLLKGFIMQANTVSSSVELEKPRLKLWQIVDEMIASVRWARTQSHLVLRGDVWMAKIPGHSQCAVCAAGAYLVRRGHGWDKPFDCDELSDTQWMLVQTMNWLRTGCADSAYREWYGAADTHAASKLRGKVASFSAALAERAFCMDDVWERHMMTMRGVFLSLDY